MINNHIGNKKKIFFLINNNNDFINNFIFNWFSGVHIKP